MQPFKKEGGGLLTSEEYKLTFHRTELKAVAADPMVYRI